MDENIIIEGYGAIKQSSSSSSYSNNNNNTRRRRSEPIISLTKKNNSRNSDNSHNNNNNNDQEWPILFGGTPSNNININNIDLENDEILPSRPRSKTTTTPPGSSLPLIHERNKPNFVIGKRKKLTTRRLSLPPILEGDHNLELLTSPIGLNVAIQISIQDIEPSKPILSPIPPSTQSPSTSKINSPRSNNQNLSSYKSPIPKHSNTTNVNISLSPCSIINSPVPAS